MLFQSAVIFSEVLISSQFLCGVIKPWLQSGVSGTASSPILKIRINTQTHAGLKGYLMLVGLLHPLMTASAVCSACAECELSVPGSRGSCESRIIRFQTGGQLAFIGRVYIYLLPAALALFVSFLSAVCTSARPNLTKAEASAAFRRLI